MLVLSLFAFFEVRGHFLDQYMIIDLDSQSNFYFSKQYSPWIDLSDSGSAVVDSCDGQSLMRTDRYSFSFKRKYTPLPSHNSAFITMSLWFVDSWTPSTDTFQVRVLGKSNRVFHTFSFSSIQYSTSWPHYTCNYHYREVLKNILLKIQSAHEGTVLQLELTKTAYPWMGIRDIQISFSNKTLSSPKFCLSSQASYFSSTIECPCPLNSFGSSGNCVPCHSSCAGCSGPSSTDCLSCAPGYSYNGVDCMRCHASCKTCFGTSENECLTCRDGQYLHLSSYSCKTTSCPSSLTPITVGSFYACTCPTSSYYFDRNNSCTYRCPAPAFKALSTPFVQFCQFNCSEGLYFYTNGSCISNCQPHFKPRNQGGYLYCDFPCASNKYLYWDGNCFSCAAPLVPENSTGYKICSYPCLDNEYLYWDRSCKEDCDLPLQKHIIAGKSFCNYTCKLTQFLYWNGTCLNSCGYPYVIKESQNRKFCNLPCLSSSYLFENGTCFPSCTSPLIESLNETVKICKRPCVNTLYYYPDEKSCKESCPPPYQFNTTDISMSCNLVITETQKKQVQQINSVSEGAADVTQGIVSIGVVASSDPGGSSASMLTKMLQYTRYLNITYSARLELMFKTKNLTSGFIPFLPPVDKSVKESFPKSQVPSVFSKYSIHPSFIMNFWEGLLSLGISLSLWTLFRICEFIGSLMKKRLLPHQIFRKVRAAIQNFILTQFYSIYSDVIMYFAIEIKTNQLDTVYLAISLGVSILLVGCGIIAIYVHIQIILEYQKLRMDALRGQTGDDKNEVPQVLENFNKNYEGMKILFFNFKDASFIHQSFFLLLNLRNSFFALVIGLLYDFPMIQISIITFFTLMTVTYLVIKRPFKAKINFLQQTFAEVILLVVDACLIYLVVLDIEGQEQANRRENVSQVIIICNLVISFVAPIFGVAKGIIAIYTYIQLKKMNATRKLTNKLESNNPEGQKKLFDNLDKSDMSLLRSTEGHFDIQSQILSQQSERHKNLESRKLLNQNHSNQVPKNSLGLNPFERSIRLKAIRGMEKLGNPERKIELNKSSLLKTEANSKLADTDNTVLNTSTQPLSISIPNRGKVKLSNVLQAEKISLLRSKEKN